jgi:hypothetical protein
VGSDLIQLTNDLRLVTFHLLLSMFLTHIILLFDFLGVPLFSLMYVKVGRRPFIHIEINILHRAYTCISHLIAWPNLCQRFGILIKDLKSRSELHTTMEDKCKKVCIKTGGVKNS